MKSGDGGTGRVVRIVYNGHEHKITVPDQSAQRRESIRDLSAGLGDLLMLMVVVGGFTLACRNFALDFKKEWDKKG